MRYFFVATMTGACLSLSLLAGTSFGQGERSKSAQPAPRCQIERFTRTDNTLRYEVRIDDPGAYTAPWTAGFLLRWDESAEVFEYICQENNLNPVMTVDDDGEPLARANRHTP